MAEIILKCNACFTELYAKWATGRSDAAGSLHVELCETCLERAVEDARKEGYGEGVVDGVAKAEAAND